MPPQNIRHSNRANTKYRYARTYTERDSWTDFSKKKMMTMKASFVTCPVVRQVS